VGEIKQGTVFWGPRGSLAGEEPQCVSSMPLIFALLKRAQPRGSPKPLAFGRHSDALCGAPPGRERVPEPPGESARVCVSAVPHAAAAAAPADDACVRVCVWVSAGVKCRQA
jgi:hypothetical protein